MPARRIAHRVEPSASASSNTRPGLRYCSGVRHRSRRISLSRRTARRGLRRTGVIAHAVGFARAGPNPCPWRSAASAVPPADGAQGVLPLRPAPIPAKAAAGAMRRAQGADRVREFLAREPGRRCRTTRRAQSQAVLGVAQGNAMAQRRLSMRKSRQALRLHYDAGLGVRAVARSLKASPSTVRERPQRQQVGSPVSALDKQRKTLLNQ